MLRKAVYIAASVIVLLCISNCRMILYGLDQGAGQLKIITNTRPVEEMLADPEFPDSLREKLLLVQEIRQFAFDSVGLNKSKNYTTFYDQGGKPLLWVVTACEAYSLNKYKWKFPFLGALAYKGFFDRGKAKKEAEKLIKRGYDVDVDDVNAWSTLGFLKDPILSNMLDRTEGSLSNLIIHELTHATVYIKGDTEWSENIATFFGNEGARYFLVSKYGADSREVNDYLGRLADMEKFSLHILHGAKRLDSLYSTFNEMQEKSHKDSLKYALIGEIIHDLDTIPFHHPARYKKLMRKKELPNNTFFSTFRVYQQQQNVVEEEFRQRFDSDFKKYMAHLKEKYG